MLHCSWQGARDGEATIAAARNRVEMGVEIPLTAGTGLRNDGGAIALPVRSSTVSFVCDWVGTRRGSVRAL
jgi:hypothetical protein